MYSLSIDPYGTALELCPIVHRQSGTIAAADPIM
jgi:hypothetical protein